MTNPEVIRWLACRVQAVQAALVAAGYISNKRLDYFIADAEKEYDRMMAEKMNKAAMDAPEAFASLAFMQELPRQMAEVLGPPKGDPPP